MARRGRSIVSAALIAVALVLFAPVFAKAATNFTFGGWQYGPQVSTVLSYVPVFLGAAALLVLGNEITRRDY